MFCQPSRLGEIIFSENGLIFFTFCSKLGFNKHNDLKEFFLFYEKSYCYAQNRFNGTFSSSKSTFLNF